MQTRNVLLYGFINGVYYLGAPVLYVGLLQVALLYRMGSSAFTANLPLSLYQAVMPFAVLAAWAFPQPRLLKRMLIAAYAAIGMAGAIVAVVLASTPDTWEAPGMSLPTATVTLLGMSGGAGATAALRPTGATVIIWVVILHAVAVGMANSVANALLWEALNRGASVSRRGQAFSLAFGFGPILAFIGSFLSQLIVNPENNLDFTVPWLDWKIPLGRLGIPPLQFPWGFVVLFATTVPCMGVAIAAVNTFRLPAPDPDPPRQPFVAGVIGGLGDYFSCRLIRRAAIAYILIYSGYMIMNNFGGYTRIALGAEPKEYVGMQLSLRFGFKVFAGFFLGWLLVRTNPKASLLVTAGLLLVGVVWGMVVSGPAYLVAFGLLGAGELMGAYYPNYILCASPPDQVRRNMSITNLATLLVAPAPLFFGGVADLVGKASGSEMAGQQASFVCSLAILGAGILLTVFALPSWPKPEGEDKK